MEDIILMYRVVMKSAYLGVGESGQRLIIY